MNFIADNTMSPDMIDKLAEYGNVFLSMDIRAEDKAIQSHPDLQIHFADNNTAFCPPDTVAYYRQILPDFVNVICGKKNIGSGYPEVSAYNIARVGRFVICNTKISDEKILQYYKENNFCIIHVNQGYTKCNICPLTKNLFLTEDRGIYNTVINTQGIDAVLLNGGNVKLNGFKNGFIGGASGVADGKLFLCGSLKHTEFESKIKHIAAKNGIAIIELSDEPLYDYGSIIAF